MTALLSPTQLDVYRGPNRQALPPSYPPNMRRFWSPIDDVHAALKAVVGSCTQSLVLAMYGYDDDELAALIAGFLSHPSIYVQITLDKSQAGGVHEAALLQKYQNVMSGNSVAIGSSEKHAIMHRKVCIVDGLWTITGSTNWSLSGEQKQDNELTVTCDAVLAAEARYVLDLEHTSALKQMADKAATAS
jgi:phosphatidylserine/phosphatidylglycerophosphate/cardiolipin synthase-like enzyme